MFLEAGAEYFNPDEAAARIASRNPGISQQQANSEAWQQGKRLLQRAIKERRYFAFETTLGGNTIPKLLDDAISAGIEVRVWYVGLEGPELHIARVRARAIKGGHDIPESKIRERYNRSRLPLGGWAGYGLRVRSLFAATSASRASDTGRDGVAHLCRASAVNSR